MDFLRKIWEYWLAFGRFLGNLIGRVILSIFYFTIMLPFGIGVTLFGDPLKRKNTSPNYWLTREATSTTLEDALRQF